MADNYTEFNIWKDSAMDYETDTRWYLNVWADDGRLCTRFTPSTGEGKGLVSIGALDDSSVEQLYHSLYEMMAERSNEDVAAVLTPEVYGGLMSWMFELVYPRDRHWLVAAVVGRALQKGGSVSLEEAFRAVFWGITERETFCDKVGVSFREFNGAHKAAVTFLPTFEEYFRIKTQDDPEVETIEWIKDWSGLS